MRAAIRGQAQLEAWQQRGGASQAAVHAVAEPPGGTWGWQFRVSRPSLEACIRATAATSKWQGIARRYSRWVRWGMESADDLQQHAASGRDKTSLVPPQAAAPWRRGDNGKGISPCGRPEPHGDLGLPAWLPLPLIAHRVRRAQNPELLQCLSCLLHTSHLRIQGHRRS